MILGFNHNVNYKGEVFHVQTEDSGISSPNITTLLYKGGVILCSKKTSYADILKMSDLETVVEELMKEQHKEVMRRLKSGEFDERAFLVPASTFENIEIPTLAPLEEPVAAPVATEPEQQQALSKNEISRIIKDSVQKHSKNPSHKSIPANDSISLDDAISIFFQKSK
jgi:ketol-acid reductoisomerase